MGNEIRQCRNPTLITWKENIKEESPYHFGSTKSKSIVKQIFHILLLDQYPQLRGIIYRHKICLTITIFVFIPKWNELFLKKVPSFIYSPQDPLFIFLHSYIFKQLISENAQVIDKSCKQEITESGNNKMWSCEQLFKNVID